LEHSILYNGNLNKTSLEYDKIIFLSQNTILHNIMFTMLVSSQKSSFPHQF